MAEDSVRGIVLMSIHPQFSQLILEGHKKVEFRKTRFNTEVSHVVIYATSPVKKIVGYFEIQSINVASPKELWRSYEKVSGVRQKFFNDYYGDASQGVAIEVGKVYPLKNLLSLSSISSSLVPPQSYLYITKETFKQISENVRDTQFSPSRPLSFWNPNNSVYIVSWEYWVHGANNFWFARRLN
ncbi:ASCH domain-containing protein [Kovacikia minuta CCNUW1]|uniref:ASCH domain-containing protein n=1 Tax=Kovacikia minuta TaxID=2931930 RepID=UPI001CCA8B88|nr:ASCH domain-containing protein [Kovacikia minuta]UBF28053.1 ASCH domain-containing protein [Kovacikia minuta CCNUW1]